MEFESDRLVFLFSFLVPMDFVVIGSAGGIDVDVGIVDEGLGEAW